ncbi:MAG: carbohydrate ABC transporter permease [Spirochaetaceae bacterium]|jgi:multiple sugar transport system permease protein|nr:carbohydrate ABC transporter permease [Spirochaetaceae bacterium]
MAKQLHRGMHIKMRPSQIASFVSLIVLSLIMLFPFFWLVRSSFMTQREIMTVPIKWLPKEFLFSNFTKAFTAAPFAYYFRNSIILTVANVMAQILSSSFIAFGFARLQFKGRGFWFAALLSTMMLPYTVVMIPQFIFWKTVGGYNTFAPLIIPALFGNAFNVFLVRQFYLSIPKDYDEAALVDGANYFLIYRRVILPMSKAVLCSVGVFTFMSTWNDFLGPLLYLDKPLLKTVSLGLQVFVGQYTSQINLMMAASTVATIPMIIIFFFAQRYFIEGITFTGLKG